MKSYKHKNTNISCNSNKKMIKESSCIKKILASIILITDFLSRLYLVKIIRKTKIKILYITLILNNMFEIFAGRFS